MNKHFGQLTFQRIAVINPVWVIAILCALMAAHLYFRTPSFPFTPDSASYIEQARNLAQVGSALETPYGLEKAAARSSTLFPIGYPVVLALISLVGVDPRDAAVFLSWSASLLLPVLLYISFRPSLGSQTSSLLAALTCLSPGVLYFSSLGTPDIFALILAIAAIGIVLHAPSRSWIMFGGFIAGGAYAVRNAHLALLLSILIFYSYLWVTQTSQRRETILNVLVFMLGASLVLLPVLSRNLLIFGSLNPYQMEPSTISVVQNSRIYLQEFFYDLSASRSLGIFVGWSVAGAALILAMSISVAWLVKTSWKQLSRIRQNTIFLCATYAVIGACVVIAARSRYEWGEMINTRHTLQYTSFFWAALLGLMPTGSNSKHRNITLKVLTAIAAVTVFLHLAYAVSPKDFHLRNERSNAASAAYENGKNFLCPPDSATITASNWGYVFRIQCSAPTRNIELPAHQCRTRNEDCGFISEAALDVASTFAGQPVRVGVFSGRGIDSVELALSNNDLARLKSAGMFVMQNDTRGILLSNQTTQ